MSPHAFDSLGISILKIVTCLSHMTVTTATGYGPWYRLILFPYILIYQALKEAAE